MSLALLKQQLATHLAPSHSDRPGVPTGIAELDAVLPARGLPRGRLTEIVGTRGWGSGKATVARRIAESALGRGEWVAYIDATRTLAPRDWAHLGLHEGLWMVRPHDSARAAWCADVILRSGAFSLVVIDGAPTLPRTLAVRLTHLARESDAALLVIAPDGAADGRASLLGGALRLRVQRVRRRRRAMVAAPAVIPGAARVCLGQREGDLGSVGRRGDGRVDSFDGRECRDPSVAALPREDTAASQSSQPPAVRITLEKGGTNQRVEVTCAIGVARRLCTNPEVPDRRGVARREGRSAVGAAPAAARGGDRTGREGTHAGRSAGGTTGTKTGAAADDGSARPDDGSARPHERSGRGFTRSRRCAEPEYGRESGAARAVRVARSAARTRPRA